MSRITESLRRDLAEVSWRDLRVHLQRDAIIVVAPELDLIETAVAVAEDDAGRVESWINTGRLGKPEAAQLDSWEQSPDRSFKMLIVQPFILIQAAVHA